MSFNIEDEDFKELDKDDKLLKFEDHLVNKESIEQRDAIINLREVLNTPPGRSFIKFLFKTLEVGELPSKGLESPDMYETLGFLRSGQAVFQLTSQANRKLAGNMLAEIQGDIYNDAIQRSQIENG